MKPLNDYINERYINEKLKLSDINKDNLYSSQWIDAEEFSYKKFKLGNIIQTSNGNVYILVREDIVNQLLNTNFPNYKAVEDNYVFIRNKFSRSAKYGYIEKISYKNNFPYTNSMGENLRIVKIIPQNKDYNNVNELKRDLENLRKLRKL